MSNLNELVARYGKTNAELKVLKTSADADNKEIKDIMSSTGLHEHVSGGYKAKYSVSKSESFDEEKLVETLKHLKINDEQFASDIPGLIEYKPVVNMDALENAIYNGNVSASDLAGCKVVKETARLTISKVKE